ncbi:fumarylacetoacetase [Novosphingobium sp. PP1Y]|uniref:fumarylacetoacetase n=1 Tax=Novosphingobium sp. PP1Y TaxID=702113 RepID=UPI00020EEB3D|nr:fumarylacetoacetase [Novosphingobium sp. PP1Y]CCA92166.1 fumarylacetoacetase [Novosphingobium sp. PP1Y]
MKTDHTHDPAKLSWVASANDGLTDFPIQNLPLGVFSPPGDGPRCGVAIGDRIFDLREAASRGILQSQAADAVKHETLDVLFALGRPVMRTLRHDVFAILESDSSKPDETLLHDMARCEMHLPTKVRNFTDFFVGIHHAQRCGEIINGDNYQLPLNYHYMPVGYNGRSSTVCVSGNDIYRPVGMRQRLSQDPQPTFGACQWMDFELEMGFFIGPGNAMGQRLSVADANAQIVGFCLLNDWSARDIQMFEMVPLGAFNGKSSGTSISPWVVTADAMEPFRIPAMARFPEAPPVPDYLASPADRAEGGLGVALAATIRTEKMRRAGEAPTPLLKTDARYLYWTCAQMVAQHTITGCALVPGDLIGTGTISGPTRADLASLFELTFIGREPFMLPNGESRGFIEDGDEIAFSGRCEREGYASIGFGTCAGQIVPAIPTAA